MHKVLDLDIADPICFRTTDGLRAIDARTLAVHRPDSHRVILGPAGELAARCSLWWQSKLHCHGRRAGLIGHYAAADMAASQALLADACRELAAQGCELAVGPIDGNTWRQYRLVVEGSSHPPFLLEPDHPRDWPEHFVTAGFGPLAYYFSALNTHLARMDSRATAAEIRLRRSGVTIRAADGQRLPDELRRIYAIAKVAFRNNLLFNSPDEHTFLTECDTLIPLVEPELILLAEHEGRAVGFVVQLPDRLQARRGEAIDTVVIKTLGCLPDPTLAGIGNVLLYNAHWRAHELGFRKSVHALVREQSHLRRLSARTARVIRRYALFAKDLAR